MLNRNMLIDIVEDEKQRYKEGKIDSYGLKSTKKMLEILNYQSYLQKSEHCLVVRSYMDRTNYSSVHTESKEKLFAARIRKLQNCRVQIFRYRCSEIIRRLHLWSDKQSNNSRATETF